MDTRTGPIDTSVESESREVQELKTLLRELLGEYKMLNDRHIVALKALHAAGESPRYLKPMLERIDELLS